MAIETDDGKLSLINYGLPFKNPCFFPDGTAEMNDGNQQQLLRRFSEIVFSILSNTLHVKIVFSSLFEMIKQKTQLNQYINLKDRRIE